MADILKALSVDVHCEQCGDFNIGADVVAESQRLLAQGCPGSPYECPPELLSTLLPHAALESLQRAWSALESGARSPVRQLSLSDPLQVVAGPPAERLEPRAVARWEDDGGYIPGEAWGAPC